MNYTSAVNENVKPASFPFQVPEKRLEVLLNSEINLKACGPLKLSSRRNCLRERVWVPSNGTHLHALACQCYYDSSSNPTACTSHDSNTPGEAAGPIASLISQLGAVAHFQPPVLAV
jgi:hypothetical protein